MVYITKRTIKNKVYYYLEETLSNKKKASLSIGNAIPKENELLSYYNTIKINCLKKNHLILIPPLTEFVTYNKALKLDKAIKNKINLLKSLTIKNKNEFIKRERVTFITESNAIEGSTLSYNETNNIIEQAQKLKRLQKKYILTGIQKEEQEAINLNKCLEWYDLFIDKKQDITEKLILKLHYILLKDIEGYDQYKGIYRPVDVYVVGSNFVFPKYYNVPELMKKLVSWYKENKLLMHSVELAAKFHTKFTTIHPFADGNGRIARLLMNYILQLNNYPFTNIPLRKRKKYMQTQASGNIEDYKPFTYFLINEIILQNKF